MRNRSVFVSSENSQWSIYTFNKHTVNGTQDVKLYSYKMTHIIYMLKLQASALAINHINNR